VSKPTILFVTEIRPYPRYGGMYIHIYSVLESLCQHYQVVVLAPPVDAACPLLAQIVAWYPLPAYGITLHAKVTNGWYILRPRPAWQGALRALLHKHQPQVVWFNYGHWGQYVPLVHSTGSRAVMRTHNIQSLLTKQRATTIPIGLHRGLTWLRAWTEALHERTLFRRFDRVVSLTEIDRHYHARFVGDDRSLLIPGFIEEATYQSAHSGGRADNLLIITGSFNSFQNEQGARWFLEEIWPQLKAAWPAVRLQLVGKGASHLATASQPDPQLETLDTVPDIVPYLRRATVALVPIWHGSGIRFKILEALASEVPVVSTSLGAQGIEVRDGESILLADTPHAFTQAILTLLREQTTRTQIAQHGLAVLRQHYTTAVNTQRIRHLVDSLVARPSKSQHKVFSSLIF